MGFTGNHTTQYQTGAPASRAAHKQHIRKTAALTRAAQLSHALALARGDLTESRADAFMPAWDGLGVAQHHDSVPGTMMSAGAIGAGMLGKSGGVCGMGYEPIVNNFDYCSGCTNVLCKVLEDYTARLDEGAAAVTPILQDSVAALVGSPDLGLVLEPTNETRTVVITNPLAQDRAQLVRVPFVRKAGETTVPSVVDAATGKGVVAQLEVADSTCSQLTVRCLEILFDV